MNKLRRITCLALGAGMLCIGGSAVAQTYPERAIRLVMPFPPGGGTDAVARSIGQRLSERLGQPVVVEARPGAGGNIAYEHVARSAPDGHTLLFATNGIATNVSLYSKLSYDTMKDFAPITLVARSPHVLVANASVPVNNLRELIALGKSKPGTLYFGSSGSGTVPHLAGELFSTQTGAKLVHVPYKGAGAAQTDLVSGSIQLMFASIASSQPFIKQGRLRALGVTGDQRSQAMPEVPTIAEAGVPGYAIEAWFAMLAPAGTPAPIVDRLYREISAIVADPELKKKMLDVGQELIVNKSPAEFSSYLRSEIKKMAEVVKTSGAVAN
ncbi:MAG: LacI family transcriptional regulator [Noviherbaspirillum sp.]|nr:LacI family transcriptional regulator [Noviherbaspirillum sp.]